MSQHTTPTSGAADLRATFSEMLVDLPNTEPFTLFQAGFDAALAAGQATAAQPGLAYAALPDLTSDSPLWVAIGRHRRAGFARDTTQAAMAVDAVVQDMLRAFADATYTLRASHGQAPAGANKPTEQQILEAAFAPAQPAAEASRFGSPELQAMIIARCVEKDQADSVLYDPKAVLDVFNSARAGSEKPVGYMRGIRAVIAHWESRPEPHRWMVPARAHQADAAAPQPSPTAPATQQAGEMEVFVLQWPGEDRINLSTVFDTEAEALDYMQNRCDTPGIRLVRFSSKAPTAQAEARRVDELTALRKQDTELIRELVEALENSNATLWEEEDDPSRPAHAAIAAGRVRLESKP